MICLTDEFAYKENQFEEDEELYLKYEEEDEDHLIQCTWKMHCY